MKFNKYILGLGLIIAAISYRFLPHVPNFSPLNAVFLFAGATLIRRYTSLIGILALVFMSDFLLNNTILRPFFTETTGIVWYSNYMVANLIGFVLIFGIGTLISRKNNVVKTILGAVAGSVVFFLVTNAGAWYFDILGMYPAGFTGLVAAITAGIPFFQNTVIGDLLFSGVLFGSYYMISNYMPKLQSAKA